MKNNWNNLANTYEGFQVKEDSLDTLVEYPAQLSAIGDYKKKRILDVACGSGRKAYEWAINGAKEVWAFDRSKEFISRWDQIEKPQNLNIFEGNLSDIKNIYQLKNQIFDIVTCFQAICYSPEIGETISNIRTLMTIGGRFILTTAHPFRFVIERVESKNEKPANIYRNEGLYSFPSKWDKSIIISHYTPMISTIINGLLDKQFKLLRMYEPDMSIEQKTKYPHKKKWMEKYFGMVVYIAEAI